MTKPYHLRSVIVTALTAALAGGAVPALANDAKSAQGSGERLVYVPHKSGYPFNVFRVPNERADFARVEIADDKGTGRRGPPPKTGNPFLPLR